MGFSKAGDGGGSSCSIRIVHCMFDGTAGAYNGDYKFRRYKSTDKELHGTLINTELIGRNMVH
jgi:hypothetical protein